MKKSLAIPFLVIAFALSACSSEKSADKNMNDMKDKNISSNSMENKNSDNSLNLEDRDGNKFLWILLRGRKLILSFGLLGVLFVCLVLVNWMNCLMVMGIIRL